MHNEFSQDNAFIQSQLIFSLVTLKKINMRLILFLLTILLIENIYSQESLLHVELEPITIKNLKGVQSFAFGQANGKWLIIGGRIDGLHRRQPFAAFSPDGNNQELVVIDPVQGKKWSSSFSVLPVNIQEQLSSTNMQFYQSKNYLYIIGGYGFSKSKNEHITYPFLTSIKVSELIEAIIKNTSITPFFKQAEDSLFAVTGGGLQKIDENYFLVGGHKFMGRYNPHGPDHGSGFFQQYTNAIRKFKIQDDGNNLKIHHVQSFVDSLHLHRRDLNVVPQILANGQPSITAFSGVFQYEEDIPFLNCVHIDSNSYTVDESFEQRYNNYHCAYIPFFSEQTKEMHTIFLGGIGQYYDSLGKAVYDEDVPFVQTVAQVTRNAQGKMIETKLSTKMPGYLGAGAAFIADLSIPMYENHVIQLDKLKPGKTFVGYMIGGIESSAPNIFYSNTGKQSQASSRLFKVYITK